MGNDEMCRHWNDRLSHKQGNDILTHSGRSNEVELRRLVVKKVRCLQKYHCQKSRSDWLLVGQSQS